MPWTAVAFLLCAFSVMGIPPFGGFFSKYMVISAAVSSVSNLSNMPGGAAASAGYAATGVVNLGSGSGGMSTTVGAGGGNVTTGSSVGAPNLTQGASGNSVGMMNNEVAAMTQENSKMLQVQMAMQRENTMFSSISNVLKTKHDTAKNSVGNIR